MHRCKRLLILAVLAIAAGVASAVGETPDNHARFDWNRVLADPAEVADELASQRERFESRIDQAQSRTDRAKARLALANWWLASPTARPATRWLIGVETAADRKAIAHAASMAERQIVDARNSLSKSPATRDAQDAQPASTRAATDDEDEDKKDETRDRSRLEQSADILAAFVEVFQLAGSNGSDETAHEEWRKAGRGLAIARESNDAELAAAALLWQAFTLAKADKRERALTALPESLLKPENLPYDLMSRLLRCRLLAESGQYSASVALLGRMETILKTWVPSQDRNSARRLISFVQYRVVSDWIMNLRTSTRPAAAATLEPILTSIDDDFADLKSPTIYYMATAVPLKVAPPTIIDKQATSTSAPETGNMSK